jgi:hypothetical protein
MAFLNEEIDVLNLPTKDDMGGEFEPVPAGWYAVQVTDCTLQPTKDGTGEYIKMRLDILGPTHQGRVIFSNLNIRNASAKAEQIGRYQLGQVMAAGGLAKVRDTDQLIGITMMVKLSIRPAQGDYKASNEVKEYKAAAGGAMPQPAMQAAPAQQKQPPAAAAPPWAKK